MKKRVTSVLLSFMILVASVVAIGSDSNAASPGWRWSDAAGNWWYETESGYAASEYIDGYWLNAAGWYDSAWNGSWQCDGNGWWFQSGGWYATDQWLKVDGKWYHFNSSGYMDVNKWIGSDYVGADGAWTSQTSRTVKRGDTIVTKCITYGSGAVVNTTDYVKMKEEKLTLKVNRYEKEFNKSDDAPNYNEIDKIVNKIIGLRVGDSFEIMGSYGDGNRKYVYTILEIK